MKTYDHRPQRETLPIPGCGEKTLSVIRSKRKTVAVEISRQGEVLVRAPERMPAEEISAFVVSRQQWIRRHMEKAQARREHPVQKLSGERLRQLNSLAAVVIPACVKRYAARMGVTYGRVTIRCQKTRWGSCSSKGNLNFNCLLMLAPPEVLTYVVVHELCHRIEPNHSAAFWTEVEKVLPDYRIQRDWLKEHGAELMDLVWS